MKSPEPAFIPTYTLLNHELKPALQTLELSSSLQIPAFHIIGLPGPEVSEAKDRVKAALESVGFEFPRRKIVLNLSPSSVRKQGTGMDLAMAVALITQEMNVNEAIFAWGELGLDGRVKETSTPFRAMDAALQSPASIAFFCSSDREKIMRQSRLLAALKEKHERPLRVAWVSRLEEILSLFEIRKRTGAWPSEVPELNEMILEPGKSSCMEELPGVTLPAALQRVVGVASAGDHHLFLAGARGTGKSLSLEWLAALRAPASLPVLLEHALIRELKGESLHSETLPVRRVGVQVRSAALYGGVQAGAVLPGEFTLASGTLLIADEFPEWQRDSREALREPLERGRITLSRVGRAIELPADFQLAANGNLCPCGGEASEHTEHLSLRCRCLPQDRARYLQRISGPILDRMDLTFRVPPLAALPGEASLAPDAFLEKTRHTRQQVLQRYGKPPGKLQGGELEEILNQNPDLRNLLDEFTFSSFRERHRSLRVALTLSAWDGSPKPQKLHFLEIQIMRHSFLFGERSSQGSQRRSSSSPSQSASRKDAS